MEEQKALRSEIDDYMNCLDEQMDAMILDPTSDKEFLGNTYKWWASFLSAEEMVQSLNQTSFPIFLVHGVEDDRIPVHSTDLAADVLKESDAFTYLRLQGYGHDLGTAEVHEIACHWLTAILSGQEANFAPALLRNKQVDISDYTFSGFIAKLKERR